MMQVRRAISTAGAGGGASKRNIFVGDGVFGGHRPKRGNVRRLVAGSSSEDQPEPGQAPDPAWGPPRGGLALESEG